MRIILVLAFVSFFVSAQEIVTRADGKKVMLSPDGSWIEIYSRPVNAKTKEKLKHGGIAIYYNSSLWKRTGYDKDNILMFEHKESDCGMIVIEQKTDKFVSDEEFKNIFQIEIRKTYPDAIVTSVENRLINNINVLHCIVEGTVEGEKLRLAFYLVRGQNCVALIGGGALESQFDMLSKEVYDFLNGVCIQ